MVTLSTTMPCATDLGYLLHKHPDRAQSFDAGVGIAHVVWPQASDERSTVALLLEIDPIALVRGKGDRGTEGFSLGQYVNDRPYVASSMMAVALGKVFRAAMAGRCEARPDLVDLALPLEVHAPAVPALGGPDLVRRLFAPLGWDVRATPIALDPQFPTWGDSRYVDLRLAGRVRLADALTHLYVLLPVLDDAKHYWVGEAEVDKLLRAGAGWLASHPERDLITRRYLRHSRELVVSAAGRLAELDERAGDALDGEALDSDQIDSDQIDSDQVDSEHVAGGEQEPVRAPLAVLRRTAVLTALRAAGAARVVDLGCGEGALLQELVRDPAFTAVLGVDVSHRSLELAARRLALERLPDSVRARLELIQSSVTYRDDRISGYDAVVLMEVIEHLDPARLPALERTVFQHARPATVLVTTPNVEFNATYETLAAGTLRHRDHRFEWTRAEFAAWADGVAAAHGYTVRFEPIGAVHPQLGPPTQLAIFGRVG